MGRAVGPAWGDWQGRRSTRNLPGPLGTWPRTDGFMLALSGGAGVPQDYLDNLVGRK